MDRVKQAQRKLTKAIRTLDCAQGRVARRNSRGRVFAAIKSLEHAIDADFPLTEREKKPETLRALAGRLTPVGFTRVLVKIAPQTWDPIEVQLFANWILQRAGKPARPIALMHGHGISEDLIQLEQGAPPRSRHVQLWRYLAGALAPPLRASERQLVRAMFEVASAWGAQEWREALPADHERDPALGLRLVGTG